MRVLAADDDEQVRDILSRFFSRLGVEAVVVASGEEALAAYKDSLRGLDARFDAAFADLAMPWRHGEAGEGGGLKLAGAIRAEEDHAGLGRALLIALTGADGEGSAGISRAGFDRFLQKPVGVKDLRKALDLR